MARIDWTNEVTRRSNLVAHVQPRKVLFTDLTDAAAEALSQHIPATLVSRISTRDEAKLALLGVVRARDTEFAWGERNLGIGLMLARQTGAMLRVDPTVDPSNINFVEAGQHVLIACESGNEMSQIIASNLTHAIGGSLVVFDPLPDVEADELIEALYQVGGGAGAARFEDLSARVRALLPAEVRADRFTEVLFVTHRFPYGIGIPERPSSHLFAYPDLGRTIVQSLWATQNADLSARTALLVQPGQVVGSEITVIADALSRNRTLTRVLEGPGASVHRVDLLLQAVPWDLVVFSSHAGDAPGSRDTYVYVDDEGRERRLIVEQAVSIGVDPHQEDIPVKFFFNYQELDGVSWSDKAALAELPVGSALHAFHRLDVDQRRAARVESIRLPRVRNAMAIKLHDHVWFPAIHALAPGASPLVVVNACSSWHQMSGLFVYAGARAYIGTMFPVTDPEAQEVAGHLLDRELGQPLSHALWRAQHAVYGDGTRRPYLLIGLPFCRVQRNRVNSPPHLHRELTASIREIDARLTEELPADLRHNFARHRELMLEERRAVERTFTPDGRLRRRN
ncbi:hypothetical protein [Solimonas sp. K1W22B-7]|uniref:hypothetical protein n=1 Tax=Solimonas sp. K1W22B-7 TaxID=2303331 RepID=UPI0013C4221B|nr:hypothetical protein [Solimonas sp. K1W22B-7]